MEEILSRPTSSFQFEYPYAKPEVPAKIHISKGSDDSKDGIRTIPEKSEIPSLVTNANLLFKHSENELGFALLRQALKIDSFHPGVLRQLAKFHHQKKNWFLAARSLEAVLSQDYSFENLAALAETYYRLGDDQKSLVRYEEALSILIEAPPSLFDVYKNIGNIHCRMGDFQAAEEYYFKAFTLNPRSDVLMVNLGTLAIQRAEYDKALEKFRMAIEFNPQNDKAWVGLAIVHDKMGDFDLARANIENAIDIAPSNRTAVHIYSSWSTRDKKYEGAIEALENYLGCADEDEEMSLALIHLFCLTEQFDLARLEIERVLLWNPKQADVLEIAASLPRSP